MTIPAISFLIGGLLFAAGIFGGGFEVKEVRVPRLGKAARLFSGTMGAIFILLAIYLDGFVDPGEVRVEETFHNPIYREYRLDLCYTFANECGLVPANKWCRDEKDFMGAADFVPDSNVGKSKVVTKNIGSEELCNAEYCSSYKSITCWK